MNAAQLAASFALSAVLGWSRLRLVTLIAFAVIAIGIVFQVLGDYQVAHSIWRTSGNPGRVRRDSNPQPSDPVVGSDAISVGVREGHRLSVGDRHQHGCCDRRRPGVTATDRSCPLMTRRMFSTVFP